mmetsp:Transcript_145583/g.369380  ORF Transcript_145583/g.369380 Transcript_145583/m.369380 type:complete len:285 (-) Transcript_145583:1-855(-)
MCRAHGSTASLDQAEGRYFGSPDTWSTDGSEGGAGALRGRLCDVLLQLGNLCGRDHSAGDLPIGAVSKHTASICVALRATERLQQHLPFPAGVVLHAGGPDGQLAERQATRRAETIQDLQLHLGHTLIEGVWARLQLRELAAAAAHGLQGAERHLARARLRQALLHRREQLRAVIRRPSRLQRLQGLQAVENLFKRAPCHGVHAAACHRLRPHAAVQLEHVERAASAAHALALVLLGHLCGQRWDLRGEGTWRHREQPGSEGEHDDDSTDHREPTMFAKGTRSV